MKKLFIILCLASTIATQSPAVSISARLNGQQASQTKSMDKAGKAIVACACDDLFPAAQEVLAQSKSEIKDLAKAQLEVMNLNKEQLNAFKRMIQECAPLALEGVHVYGAIAKKHSKSIMSICKTNMIQMLTVDKNGDALKASDEQGAALVAMIALFASDSQCNAYLEKVAAANDKWDSLLVSIFDSMQKDETAHLQEVRVQRMQSSLQNILAAALSNKRAMGIQSLIIPVISNVKTQADLVQVLQACLNELETKLPQLVGSTEKFADFAIPFVASVLIESIDETLNSTPA